MYDEDSLLPVSALQHLLVCPRQCALIHLEGAWSENRFTMEGRILHEKAHEAGRETRDGVLIVRGLMVRSLRLGLTGKTDVVEFHPKGDDPAGDRPSGLRGRRPFPVEYKRGSPKMEDWDKVQLCAQGLCLEEMLAVDVPSGALFYGKIQRRLDVEFDARLREATEEAAARLHELVASRTTPKAVYGKKCEKCSLFDRCLPKAMNGRKSAVRYLDAALAAPREGE